MEKRGHRAGTEHKQREGSSVHNIGGQEVGGWAPGLEGEA